MGEDRNINPGLPTRVASAGKAQHRAGQDAGAALRVMLSDEVVAVGMMERSADGGGRLKWGSTRCYLAR